MRRLNARKGAVPRAFADHRSAIARRYAAYCHDVQARLGTLPATAATWLREAGLAAVELERLAYDLEAARARRRVRLANGIRRQQHYLRQQLLALEARLAELSAAGKQPEPLDLARAIAAQLREKAADHDDDDTEAEDDPDD